MNDRFNYNERGEPGREDRRDNRDFEERDEFQRGEPMYGQSYGREEENERYQDRDRDEFQRQGMRTQNYGNRIQGGSGYTQGRYGQESGQGRYSQDFGQGRYSQDFGQGRYDQENRYGQDFAQGRYGQENRWRSGQQGMGQNYGQGMYGNQGQQGMFGRPGQMSESSMTESHWGKGPKGYQKSDERLKDEVSEHLMQDHSVDASEIEVQVKDSEVTLTGTVKDRQQKRYAEDCVDRVSGVKHVNNQLRVNAQGISGQSGHNSMGQGNETHQGNQQRNRTKS